MAADPKTVTPLRPATPQPALMQMQAAALDPGHPEPREYERWEELARFPNFWEGRILAGLLRNEGVPAIDEFVWPDLDPRSYSVVYVPRELAHRARWILAWPAPAQSELNFLATGELD